MQLPVGTWRITFILHPPLKTMTLFLLQNFQKQVMHNLFAAAALTRIELPLVTPVFTLLSGDADASRACTCCGWKGSEMKARKHYLIVEAIAELEFFCPSCNQYLGYTSEPLH